MHPATLGHEDHTGLKLDDDEVSRLVKIPLLAVLQNQHNMVSLFSIFCHFTSLLA